MYIYICNLKIFQDFCSNSILASSPYSRDSWFRPLSEMMFLDRMLESLRVWVFGCMAYAYGRNTVDGCEILHQLIDGLSHCL